MWAKPYNMASTALAEDQTNAAPPGPEVTGRHAHESFWKRYEEANFESLSMPADTPPEAVLLQVDLLSDRELEMFQLLGKGCSTRQIAEELHVGFKTVQSFNARIKEKLKLASATELLREALRWHDGQGAK